jgi:hypothetical protein
MVPMEKIGTRYCFGTTIPRLPAWIEYIGECESMTANQAEYVPPKKTQRLAD